MADNQTPDLDARWKILDVLAAILSSLDLNLRLYSFFLSLKVACVGQHKGIISPSFWPGLPGKTSSTLSPQLEGQNRGQNEVTPLGPNL